MDDLVVRPAARLRGRPALPGDKSISHRALLLALLAEGESRIAAAGDGGDERSTAGVVRALGATVERVAERGGRVDYRLHAAEDVWRSPYHQPDPHAAFREYLAWEIGLVEQVERDGTARFRRFPPLARAREAAE